VKRAAVTGGAGFIGSAIAERLVADGVEVVVVDNFSTGRREFVDAVVDRSEATIVEGDVLDGALLERAFDGCDTIFHLAANADVRHGLEHPERDLEQNALGTLRVLEAMRSVGARRIAFASTGSVYGEPSVFPTPEECPFPVQTSLYASSKLASEGFIASYCHAYGFTGLVFRFVSVLGERYTHGHVIDFYRALRRDPARLHVLGDGRQEKSYLYVQDCVDGVLTGLHAHDDDIGFFAYNLGTDETLVVDDSVAIIAAHLGVDPVVEYGGGTRGWPGDSPLILLDCSRIRALGWTPRLAIGDAVRRTLAWFDENPHMIAEARL
jgi:UDP-glucose 4-epimerase